MCRTLQDDVVSGTTLTFRGGTYVYISVSEPGFFGAKPGFHCIRKNNIILLYNRILKNATYEN